jgi:imipenem/basic amino acid-specific outer membrane pore
MKLVKMSLAAAVLMGVNAFAIDNVKVSGDAELYYATADMKYDSTGTEIANNGLFNKATSAAQASLGLGITADLLDNVTAGAHMTALSTLGLQGQLVDNVWDAVNGVSDYYWFDEAWIAATLGKTTAKIGRMKLDTPLVYTETWSIVENTFAGAVLLNQNIPNTTLVAAYVGEGNGNVGGTAGGYGAVVGPMNPATDTTFNQFYNGAYAFGIVNNSVKPLTLQGWYYDATHVVTAYWLQADLAMDQGILAGAQYSSETIDKTVTTASNESNDVWAVMLGFKMKDMLTIKGSYSQTGKNDTFGNAGFLTGANLATNPFGTSQSKLYTEAWWNYGYVTLNDTSAWNITVTGNAKTVDWGLYYTSSTTKDGLAPGTDLDMNEFTATAGKDFGQLNATLAYIYTDAGNQNVKPGDTKGSSYNTLQAYLTLNF